MGVEHATPLVLLIIIWIFVVLLNKIALARKKTDLYIRRIPGIDGIDEAIGRSAELGRPLSFSTGLTAVGPLLYAVLGVLSHVAKKAAVYKSKLLVPQNDPQVLAIAEEVIKDSYRVEGRLGDFDRDSIRFLSEDQFAFACGYMGMMHREKVAAAFLFGYFAAESLILAEAGQQVGAMQVAASTSPEQVPFFITSCDYTLIGEELFAASAYLTREPVQLGGLYSQDKVKLGVFLLIVLGVVLESAKSFYPALTSFSIESLFNTPWSGLF